MYVYGGTMLMNISCRARANQKSEYPAEFYVDRSVLYVFHIKAVTKNCHFFLDSVGPFK